MQSKKEFVRSGWLRFATAYLLRPPELWPKGTATASELGSALARWESAFEGSSSRHAACYWLTVARPRDRKLALALGNAQTKSLLNMVSRSLRYSLVDLALICWQVQLGTIVRRGGL